MVGAGLGDHVARRRRRPMRVRRSRSERSKARGSPSLDRRPERGLARVALEHAVEAVGEAPRRARERGVVGLDGESMSSSVCARQMKFEPLKRTPRSTSSCWTQRLGRAGLAARVGLADGTTVRGAAPPTVTQSPSAVRVDRARACRRARRSPFASRCRRTASCVEVVEHGAAPPRATASRRRGCRRRRPPRSSVHHVRAAGERGDRHAVAQRLAEAGQVGRDAVALLRAARREPEAGDDLVEDEQRAVPRAPARRTPSRKPGCGRLEPDGSRITRGDLAGVRSSAALERRRGR